MTPTEFVAKWSHIQQKETAVAHSHFNDICALVGHKPPLAYDPTGDDFSFETQAVKPGGGKGFADVFFRERFIWEYKGPHKDLDKAYQQLQLYREALENPPLLITSDIHTVQIHTNFNNYPIQTHVIRFDDILKGEGVEKLTWAFFTPERFKPEKSRQRITKATADSLLRVADEMKKHRDMLGVGSYSNEQLAHFLVRLLFALFAEDMGLLPDNLFTQIVRARGGDYAQLHATLRELFNKMRDGGTFGLWPIRHFNGTLFDDDFVPDIPHDLGKLLLQAAEQDWSQIDPSIFGTLFERVIDEGKRAQLGAHYTSEPDIMLIVEPVLMAPLKRRWDDLRRELSGQLNDATSDAAQQAAQQAAHERLTAFAAEIAAQRVLDPSCGSGNFLYVALRELLNLQKEVVAFAARWELTAVPLTAGPEQLYGIEINAYAHELAQITVWIGYLQWRHENGFSEIDDPVLRPLTHIKRMDAILTYDAAGKPVEPEWPAAEVIIGNPPFLGMRKMSAGNFSQEYAHKIQKLYRGRVPGDADLVCYWFEKARQQIENDKTNRAGLLATNSIRGGSNRKVLERIKETGDIFMAWSDRPWILDGAAVRVSMIGFDKGSIQSKQLDGKPVSTINSDLTSSINLTTALSLTENFALSFKGVEKAGSFDLTYSQAQAMWDADSQNGSNTTTNRSVIKRLVNGLDIVRRPRNMWVIDFDEMTLEEAQKFKAPIEYLKQYVKPTRDKNQDGRRREKWWQFGRNISEMRTLVSQLNRYIATPAVSKHMIFTFFDSSILPDGALVVITREDDYFFGVLHSRLHEIWALRMGTWLGKGNDPRYTPTTTFETFPFPWPPGQEPAETEDSRVAAIAQAARALVAWRDAWLNPPRDGLYAGLGPAYDKLLAKRTLTNLYNGLAYYRQTAKAGALFAQAAFDKETRQSVTRAQIQELDDLHIALDTAVLAAYGWPLNLTDEQILERLLTLNLERAAP